MDTLLKDVGTLFYIISPSGTAVEKIEDLPKPNYVIKAIPYFVTFILLEYFVQILKGKRRTRINDGITSISTGFYLVTNDFMAKGLYHYFYIKIYENWKVAELPWDSPVTWWLTAIGVDFVFYWIHRASHEMNFLWAHHQVHHSSEDFNLTTAVRQPGFQLWFVWVFYIPLAFFVPPPIFMIHQQFNLIYQFWIHTNVIDNLGPLEWIFNTPQHHRIHHGSNRYCLDKNYAGWLIIWDRLFGTFEKIKPGEEIRYGLVEDVKSFNPFWLEFFYVPKIWSRMKEYDSLTDKISVLVKGPGWTPGKPRLGDINEVPLYPTREIHDVKIPFWKNAYVVVHFAATLFALNIVAAFQENLNQLMVLGMMFYILSSMTSIGLLLENRLVGSYVEIFRCLLTAYVLRDFNHSTSKPEVVFVINMSFVISAGVLVVELLFRGTPKTMSHKLN